MLNYAVFLHMRQTCVLAKKPKEKGQENVHGKDEYDTWSVKQITRSSRSEPQNTANVKIHYRCTRRKQIEDVEAMLGEGCSSDIDMDEINLTLCEGFQLQITIHCSGTVRDVGEQKFLISLKIT